MKVMATARGITDTKIYDRQAVIDRYGIPPELIPDFYGLKGDSSDNIPGVPGIGDKTASELIQSFGTLEGVLEHIDEVKGAKRKANLLEHAEDARLSKQLATVQRDVDDRPRRRRRSRCARRTAPACREVFREYELRDPLRRLEEALGEGRARAGGDRGRAEAHRTPARRHAGRHRAPGRRGGRAVRGRAGERAAGGRAVRGRARRGASPWPRAGEVLAGECCGPG